MVNHLLSHTIKIDVGFRILSSLNYFASHAYSCRQCIGDMGLSRALGDISESIRLLEPYTTYWK